MTESPAIDHVVVLGGGYAGLRIAVDLAASFRRHGLSRRISLVDRSAHHQLVTTLHRGATEARDLASCRLPLDELLVPGTVTRREATVAEIRPERREVLLEGGEALPYERLAVALGSSPARPEIDGLEEHGLALRRWSDAERLRDHVRSVLRHAAALPSREERKSFLTLVIAGGGATGCQLAGELAHWLPSLADDHGIAVDELELILLESGSSLLADSGAEGSRYAFETLRRKGVEVRLGASVDRVRPGSVRYGGETLSTRTVVWTGGIEAPLLLARAGLEVCSQGRVVVDSRLRARGFPEIYVAGDAAFFPHGDSALPTTAAVAQHQGAYVATAISGEILGRSPSPYRPRDLGRLVSLGGDDAVGQMLGLPLYGSGAGFVKDNIERWYEATVTRRLPLMDL